MATATDYTREEYAGDIDDFVLPGSATIDKTPEQIKSDNEFKSIPAGDHTVQVHSFPYPPKEVANKVLLGGSPAIYAAYTVCVRFCLPGDTMTTFDDYFTVPPASPSELDAYFHGVAMDDNGNTKGKGGFEASKFYQFIGSLGFAYNPGQPLPPHALKLGNWKGRKVDVTVVGGTGTYVGKDGQERPSKSRAKLFSYRAASGGAAPRMAPQGFMAQQAGGSSHAAQPAYAAHAPAAQRSPARPPAPAASYVAGDDAI